MKVKFKNTIDSVELQTLINITFKDNFHFSPEKNFNYSLFLELIKYHRLEQFVFDYFKQNEIHEELFLLNLKDTVKEKSLKSMQLIQELIAIEKLFEIENIPIIHLKGPVLSNRLNQDSCFRTCRDIDILIIEKDIDNAKKCLLSNNYRIEGANFNSFKQKQQLKKNFHHINFVHNETGVIVELHWKLFASNFISEEFQKSVWDNKLNFNFHNFNIAILNEVNEFVFLCIHGSRHLWNRLFWLKDIEQILSKYDASFVNLALEVSKTHNVNFYVEQAHDLLNYFTKNSNEIATRKSKTHSKITELSLKTINKSAKENSNKLTDFFSYYKSIYYIEGFGGVYREFKMRRIKPENWNYYAFPDKVFYLNSLFSRTIWMLRKLKKRI